MSSMASARSTVLVALLAFGLLGGCSSSGGAKRTSPGASASPDAPAAAVQSYLDAVNRLCDDLLPKVVAVTKGGSFDIPLDAFFAQLPAHSALRTDFDRQLARIPVPAAAKDKARVLDEYIRFADRLDAHRLRAARAGPAAYAREIATERGSAADDPTITARTAAGFHESCNAR
jgi:hypothetical protein